MRLGLAGLLFAVPTRSRVKGTCLSRRWERPVSLGATMELSVDSIFLWSWYLGAVGLPALLLGWVRNAGMPKSRSEPSGGARSAVCRSHECTSMASAKGKGLANEAERSEQLYRFVLSVEGAN